MSERRDVTDKVNSEWAPFSVDYGYYCPLMSGSIDGTDSRPHDRGVTRAMAVKYAPNKQVTGDLERTLFVARLSHETSEDTLREMFSKYGKIVKCRLVRDIVTGRSKGYGFLEFKHSRDAADAYNRTNKMYLDGSQIIVEFECSRTLPGWVPRRFGGGFGGKKESGQLRFGGRDRPFRKPIVLGSRVLHGGQRGYERERGRPLPRDSCDRPSSRTEQDARRYHHRDRQSGRERLSSQRDNEKILDRHRSSGGYSHADNTSSRSCSRSPHTKS